MARASFRFHGSLNDFLPARRRGVAVWREFEASPGVVDAIGALGVPHTEVDLVEVDGRSVGLGYRLQDGDRVEVYGLDRLAKRTEDKRGAADREVGVQPVSNGLIPTPPEPRRFVLDGHLGRLARYLRMLGFDSRYGRNAGDAELARMSATEDRILLTRDRGLLKRSIVRHGYLVRADEPRTQLAEVVDRYGLAERAMPFSRCVRCNGSIEPVAREEIADRLAGEPRTLRYFDTFGRCADCQKVYWPGSHYERMSLLIRDVLHPKPAIGENRSVSTEDGG